MLLGVKNGAAGTRKEAAARKYQKRPINISTREKLFVQPTRRGY
jgi:hypothetical protein